MPNFRVVAAQGEITIKRVGGVPKNKKLPKGFVPLEMENGHYVIGHSETGHHHVINDATAVIGVMERPPEGMRILYMILENPLEVKHLRGFDTHAPLQNEPGVYEVRIAREYDPYAELARISAD